MGWDSLAVLLAACLSAIVYSILLPPGSALYSFWRPFIGTVIAPAVVSPFLLRDPTMTRLLRFRQVDQMLASLFRRGAFLVMIMLALGFATHSLGHVSRLWVVLWAGLTLVFSAIGRLLLARYLQWMTVSGTIGDRVAIVGAGPVADRLIERFSEAGRSIHVVGVFDDRLDEAPSRQGPPPGSISDLVELAKQRAVDWIVLSLPATAEDRIASVLGRVKTISARIALCPEHVKLGLPHRWVDDLAEMPMMLLSERPLSHWQLITKGLEDKILASILLVLTFPLLCLITLAILLDSSGPAIFRQRRHGWNNAEFTILKFRTMRYQPDEPGVLRQTRRGDERLTRLGAFLRRSSLDELPQLFNVLRGEMSLVGPRPHAVTMRTANRQGHEIIAEYAHRHRVKPGITGWAQVNGFRGAAEGAEQLRRRVECDLFYIENWSLMFDLKILALTCLRLGFGKNAY